MADTHTHLINACARPVGRNQFRAECGRLVDSGSHARDGQPTCPDCAAVEDESAATALSLGALQSMTPSQMAAHFGGGTVETRIGNPAAGARPRRRR